MAEGQSPIRQTYEHYSARGMVRPWTAKPAKSPEPTAGDESASRVPSLMELCMNMIANNLHTIPSIEYLPSHLMKDILDRRKNECMTDADLGFFLAATFEAVPAEQLDFLSMRSCRNVTDGGFGFVFRSCQCLQTLDLAFSELVGDLSMQALAESCSSLTSLNLTGCRQVSDGGCTYIGKLKQLNTVELELCNKITDIGIQTIVRSCNTKLQIIADHCPSLRSLSIAGNMQAMDLDVADVCKKATVLPIMSSLTLLDLRGCKGLTPLTKQLIDKYCVNMDHLTFPC